MILPMDVTHLYQAGSIIILSETDTSTEDNNSWNSEEDPYLGLEGSDLLDYLRDREELDAIDAAYLQSSNPTASSSNASASITN